MNIIEQIKAEIERRKKALHCALFNDEYNDLLSFLSTLESGKPVPKNLDEYAQSVEDYHDVGDERGYLCTCRGDIKDAVITGAKWQKEQMMNGATEGKVVGKDIGNRTILLTNKPTTLNMNDKVRIIIVEEN